MAGLYIHIPFCRQQCYYCDFHFTVSFRQKDKVLAAIKEEIRQRADEAKAFSFQSVYFGGGTPSILTPDEFQDFFSLLYNCYTIDPLAEITLEANPDDIKKDFLLSLKNSTPVNRLSIGIQSFYDRDLQLMNRLHTASDAKNCIENVKSAGFDNFNIDLIYGIPGSSGNDLWENLKMLEAYKIPHLSAYHLTIEPRTVFAYYRKKGKMNEITEDESLAQFETLIEFTALTGYEHYEISNFAKPGYFSKHNLGYWTQKPYIGFGPSAHSFDGKKRRWNIANNTRYMQSVEQGKSDYFEWEDTDEEKAYNEYILTSLRTMWGIDLEYLGKRFGNDLLQYCLHEAREFLQSGKLVKEDNKLRLSHGGKLITDYVITELMKVK